MTHPLPERLSLYLDGDLDPALTREIESHLAGCEECAALLSELRWVVARAQALEDRPPKADLWPGVAAAIGAAPRQGGRIVFSIPQLLAASVALMLLSGGAVVGALRFRHEPRLSSAPQSNPGMAAPVATVAAHPVAADRGYEAAIRGLQAKLDAGRGKLDSTTVRVVEEKLRLVDRAILEAERALAADPANAYLTGHLTQTRLRKLELLRRATALTRAVS
jgi:anti-sigma factor RsiW